MNTQKSPDAKRIGTVIVDKKDGVATITMSRPEKLNALSPELADNLIEAFNYVSTDDGVKVVILTGEGKAFSAGGDVKTDIEPLQSMNITEFNTFFEQGGMKLYKLIMDIDKPVIAAINGHAVGAGMDLALSCDIRIAAEDAKLGEFFVRMGLCPEVGPYLLTRLIGLERAKYLALTGDIVTANEALQMGLVSKVVPTDQLMPAAEELARKLANGPRANGIIKRAINKSLDMTLERSIDYVIGLLYQAVHTDDHKEAVKAFFEKRQPIFRGR